MPTPEPISIGPKHVNGALNLAALLRKQESLSSEMAYLIEKMAVSNVISPEDADKNQQLMRDLGIVMDDLLGRFIEAIIVAHHGKNRDPSE